MLRVFADNHDDTVSLDYLALFAYLFYRRLNFHFEILLLKGLPSNFYLARQVILPFVRS